MAERTRIHGGDQFISDNVNHPFYYKQDNRRECIDEIHEMLGDEGTICFCLGNVHKYLYRLNDKGAALNNALKAEWYANYAHKLTMCASDAITQKYLPRIRYYKAEIEKAMREVQND